MIDEIEDEDEHPLPCRFPTLRCVCHLVGKSQIYGDSGKLHSGFYGHGGTLGAINEEDLLHGYPPMNITRWIEREKEYIAKLTKLEFKVVRWPVDDHRGDWWVISVCRRFGWTPIKKFGLGSNNWLEAEDYAARLRLQQRAIESDQRNAAERDSEDDTMHGRPL